MPGSLIVVHVHAHVKPDAVEAFRAASIDNARASLREPGVARFDVVQSTEDPTRFVLVEVYRTADAPAAHKATAHYARWRDAVADLMAEPRTAARYVNVAPRRRRLVSAMAADLAFELAAPARIVFGAGRVREVGAIARDAGRARAAGGRQIRAAGARGHRAARGGRRSLDAFSPSTASRPSTRRARARRRRARRAAIW